MIVSPLTSAKRGSTRITLITRITRITRIRPAGLLAVGLVCGIVASSTAWGHPPIPFVQPNVELQVLVDGRRLPQIPRHRGRSGTCFLPVPRIGCEYVIRVRNQHHRSIEAVVSVDGLSVINGQRAAESIRGYLVRPGQTVEIPGWRRGDHKVAAFTFSRREQSYAYLTGRPNGIGMIQLTAFEEAAPVLRPKPPLLRGGPEHQRLSNTAAPKGGAASERGEAHGGAGFADRFRKPARRHDVGTGYGRELGHEVTRVPFQRGPNKRRITLHYGRETPPYHLARSHEDFVPPPPGYDPGQ